MGITSRTFKISLFSLGSRNCSFSSLTASGLEALQALNRFIPDVLALLPFVPILRGGAEASVVQQALQQLRADEQRTAVRTIVSIFC
ncbi:hypothetical protein [Scytonema sp. UIC 10036]|uniref:hypothetical protein n=1 Tax=Scytonema sp. UIC 10036 TaxID=2304196 RepID=UPI00140FC1F7|nr:hypothetical protein [Scytonema sp. UIC 10036]